MEYNATNPLPSLLKHFRKKAGLTQTDVATALSMSRSGYANYEEGRNIPNIEQTLQLSELLHHDLLYAYTLSSRYMRARSNRSRQMVMESGHIPRRHQDKREHGSPHDKLSDARDKGQNAGGQIC